MTERVKRLRNLSLNALPYLSPERAKILTDFYKRSEFYPTVIQRALSFMEIMEKKEIYIGEDELIVGERGPAPKATYTYPEICCHTINDLDILNTREKIPFKVDEEMKQLYEQEIIPFWKNKSIREKIFNYMTDEWKDSYAVGIFTEFMEQRAPGHTVLDDKIYKKGMLDFKKDIEASLSSIDKNDPNADSKRDELAAMSITVDAIINLSLRYADKAGKLALKEIDSVRKAELKKIEKVCRNVPSNKPESFWEALQYYWFVHLGVITELNPWDAFNPGRLDQHLYPFYKKEIEEGTLTKEETKELLQCFWIKFNNQPAPPKVGVTAAESSTYTDFANINTGGLRIDGTDGVNDLSFLVLDVIDEMRLVQPSSNIQLSKNNPDEFLKRACNIIRKGWGQPSIFNADTIVEEMLRQGKSIEDARVGGTSGCVETGAFGKESYILTGYFNMPKVLEITLNNGVDPRANKKIGMESGDINNIKSFDELMAAYRNQLKHFIKIKMEGNNVIERIYAEQLPVPFLSVLIDDCILKGKDYNAGGARYNTNYIQGVGVGTMTDSLAAIKFNVFDNKKITLRDFVYSVNSNFENNELLRLQLLNKTPKYGNDDDYADSLMLEVFESFFCEVDGKENTKGGFYRINLLPTTCHVYFGSVTRATPDGRKAGTPLSEGISPVQGADRKGPTAVLKSAGKMDHKRTGGTLLNQKFTPGLLENEKGINNLSHLVRAYFTMGGHHIQFNVVNADTLRKAQLNPDEYRDLIVRVAGYSDYFCDLGKTLQDEIIERTEHGGWNGGGLED